MEKAAWKAMIERRGYTLGVHFSEKQDGKIECTVGDHEAGITMYFDKDRFARMTYEEARDYIDDALGQEMRHVMHTCGQVLLEANSWWSGMGPYNDFEWGFYTVPLDWVSKPLSHCPTCQQELSLEEDNNNDDDEMDGMDEETYEKLRPTVLPRVDDPGLSKDKKQ